MDKIINGIKNNKLLGVLIIYIIFTQYLGGIDIPVTSTTRYSGQALFESTADSAFSSISPRSGGAAPRLDIEDRKVVTNSNLSLVVSDVRESISKITALAKNGGGYMVNSSLSSPEGLSNGNITIRVLSENLDSTLVQLRELSVKVVSENITGRDITDEFVDTEARLETLETTKTRYESILDSAIDVEDILAVTQQILNIQSQIDTLKGRLAYLENSSSSSLITIYLSTDEFELPYTPDQPWRPSVIFKTAVRSLVGAFQSLGTFAVWAAVYAVIWIPALIIYKKIKKKRVNLPKQSI